MSSFIARLGAILSLDTKEFVKGVDAAQLKSKEFKKNLRETQEVLDGVKTAANATALAMLAFSAIAVKTAEEITDLAEANETTIGKVLELKKALIASGGDAGKLSQLFTSFTNAVDDAAQGSDKLRDAFKAVGVTTKDLGLLSSDELRQKTLKGLAQIEDAVTRNSLAFQFFGKAAKNVDFTKMGEEADNVAGKYDKQAEAIKSAADAAGKLELFFGDMKIAAIQAIKPVSDLVNLLPSESRIEAMTKGFQVLGTTLAIAFGVKAVRGVVQLGNAIRMIAITNPWLLALTAAATVGAYVFSDQLNPLPDDEEYPKTQNTGSGGGGRKIEQSARDKAAATNLEKEAEKRRKELEKANELEQNFAEMLKNSYDRQAKYNAQLKEMYEINKNNSDLIQADFNTKKQLLDLEAHRHTMTENEYQTAKLNIQATEKLKDLERNALEAKLAALAEFERASSDEQVRAKEIYDAKIFYIERELEIRTGYAEQLNDMEDANLQKAIDRQKSWSAGWAEAMKEYTETAEKASLRGRAAFESVTSNMETAIRRFVDTGKFAFKDFVGSVIKDLLVMEMRAQASMILRSIISSFSGMPTGGGANPSASLIMSGVGKKASGGRIDSPTIVGENGAELFVPQTSGTVIPNGSWQQMAAAGGGNNGITVNGNYIANMSAIDTQSATQFLAKNKSAIWASYQSANRSVPISR
jgi:lambda family phage tail tape measure protein